MKQLKDIAHAYFIGVGGIGMSALARYLNQQNVKVYGYDKTPSAITDALIAEGIQITFQDEIDQILTVFSKPSEAVLVVYTPAIPLDSVIKKYLEQQGHALIKRAALLGLISANHFTIAVAGTHGKTTTSSLIAHIIYNCGYQMIGILGGVSTSFNSNYIAKSSGKTIDGKVILVTEADEFDRSFLHLHPNIAVITSTDADHLDIYGSNEAIEQSFQAFANQMPANGSLIVNENAKISNPNLKDFIIYGSNSTANSYFSDVKIAEGAQYFDWHFKEESIKNIEAGLPGLHNIENAVAAASACLQAGLGFEEIKKSIGSFKGVKRRFEYAIKNDEFIVIDDYAHHPSELDALIKAVRTLYPKQDITLLFQPHLYSRTRDFAAAFSKSLSAVETLRILPIYPARELPIEGVSSEMLLESVTCVDSAIIEKEAVLDFVKATMPKLLIIAGAGDIDRLVSPIKTIYDEQPATN